ncbi:Gfo/Idh/MocA family protein [Nocardiopsis baichengensis]|uniref:Gfo/Idh/MocA family protein n=1 Tax=Nocardiopsis baichengensis TaxID=280240 RepID=UPI000349E763|nr:Gfo/Idh/MocA family oxidoreductase [Nocardiopsis baichengensis]
MSGGPVGVGVVGAGVISEAYLRNLVSFPDLDVRFVADVLPDRAAARAREFGVPHWGGVDELLDREDVEIVVNLTVPAAHTDVAHRALAAGRHVWNEKPLALDADAGGKLVTAARDAGLRVGCAPDTVLGAGIQTALRAMGDGAIGRPLTANAVFLSPGPESWHPDPAFLYAEGGGPLLDMGPYYLTTLVGAFGAVESVAAAASTAFATRTVGSGPRAGSSFPVQVPTHHAALVRFCEGGSAQATFSFQSALRRSGVVEVAGDEGVLVLPDPNRFDGASTLWRRGEEEPRTIAPEGAAAGRGLGVLELARAIRAGRPERASGELAAHVLEVMAAIGEAARTGSAVAVHSRVPRPDPLPAGWDPRARELP